MHSLLIFVAVLILTCFVLSDRIRANADENLNAKFQLPWPKAVLFGSKLNLAVAKIDLSNGKIGLTVANADLSSGKIDLTVAKVGISGGDSSGGNTNCKIIKPSAFTFCLTVNLSVNGKEERFQEVNDVLNNKFKFAIEVTNDGSRLVLHNYKEEFGKTFSWVSKPTECCVSWISSTQEFHLYLEGQHVLGGTGQLEWGYSDKIEYVDQEGGQTRDAMSGPITDLYQWNRVLSKDEVQQVADGSLKGDVVKEKVLNWKITAVEITEPFQRPSILKCSHPTTSQLDLNEFKPEDEFRPITVEGHVQVPDSIKFDEITFCVWIYFNTNKSLQVPILAFTQTERSSHSAGVAFVDHKLLYSWKDQQLLLASPITQENWQHVCIAWSGIQNNAVYIYNNGELHFHTTVKTTALSTGGDIYFFNSQNEPVDPKNPTQAFALKTTGIDVWNSTLTPSEVLQHYECSPQHPGNVISWEKSPMALN